MACIFRQALIKQICVLTQQFPTLKLSLSEDSLPALVTLPKGQKINNTPVIVLNLKAIYDKSKTEARKLTESLVNQFQSNDLLQNPFKEKDYLVAFEASRKEFIKEVLYQVSHLEAKYGFHNDLHKNSKEKIVIDFSSPNIAKPFHAGHLRSTIIGNFIANIYKALGHQVIGINYLGDWGTQFGMLAVGFSRFGCLKLLQSTPMNHLLDVYVKSNQLVETDPSFYQQAKDHFSKMENGDKEGLILWQKLRQLSIEEYDKSYKRLGVMFDTYDGESQYACKAKDIVLKLQAQNFLQQSSDGTQGVTFAENKSVVLVKSDGSTLYLTRDIAAAFDRIQKYDCDQLLYVVENGQSAHFDSLFNILRLMGVPECRKLHHIKFGRIHGMSTRKGNVVFLKEILDEGKIRCLQTMAESPNTKVDNNDEVIADILGMSAIFINDMKQQRIRDYQFKWEEAVKVKGDTGVRLQYAHARLCSIERNCGLSLRTDVDTSLLKELEAIQLVQEIARFEEVVYMAHRQLEPCIIVQYLFNLCHLINRANRVLQVKNQEENLSQARLLLFHCSRQTLANGMQLLGLKPLEEM